MTYKYWKQMQSILTRKTVLWAIISLGLCKLLRWEEEGKKGTAQRQLCVNFFPVSPDLPSVSLLELRKYLGSHLFLRSTGEM